MNDYNQQYVEKLREANQAVEQSINGSPEQKYWMQLFANLVNASPVDTRNMVTHIVMYENQDDYIIEINAPYATNPNYAQETVNGFSDYSYAVNYGNKSPHKGWVENQINLTARIVGARVSFLGE